MDEALLGTLKALSDASRLRIVGLLASRAMTVEEVAGELRLSPRTVVHHLARLRDAGLVSSDARDRLLRYSLSVARLHEIGRQVDESSRLDRDAPELAAADGTPLPAEDVRILRAFFEEGRLTTIPAQEKKRLAVLRYLAATVFTEPRSYPEKEVNQRLGVVHPDVASLRRYLVDYGFMSRERGQYSLRPQQEWPG